MLKVCPRLAIVVEKLVTRCSSCAVINQQGTGVYCTLFQHLYSFGIRRSSLYIPDIIPLGRGLEGEEDLLTVASSTLCNLLLEFSPSKEPILESGGVELLCSLTRRPDPALRLNGIWALMNVAFQAEQRVKSQILSCLGTDQIFRLLADPELAVLMKTLGLLRNLLSTKAHIDRIMLEHSAHVMQAVILVLEDPEHPADVKEQALCILANVADGDRARDHIMANEDVLKKLMDYMV